MTNYEDVCALVPTRNEAEDHRRHRGRPLGVRIGLYDVGIGHILVVDGHSEDDTREIARAQRGEDRR